MRAETDVTISGAYGAVLNAGGGATGLEIAVDGIDVVVRDLTLTGGTATKAVAAGGVGGGGILCERAGGATLTLEEVTITGNTTWAELVPHARGFVVVEAGSGRRTITGNTTWAYGGGLYVDGCTVTMEGGAITHNTAQAGAGAFVIGVGAATVVNITGSEVASNTASLSGGGLYVMTGGKDATVDLVDTRVSGDTSMGGGGGLGLADGGVPDTSTRVTCTGGSFVGNVAEDAALPGGGVYLVSSWGNGVAFTSTGCDFGAAGTDEDNTPADTYVYGKSAYIYASGASFSCDGSGCR